MSILHGLIAAGNIPAAGGYDSDAQAFFTASGLSDIGQQEAVSDLVIALKAAGVWTKCNAIYPIVGGSAALHKWNLKNPADTNGAFRLVFTGTWTHSSNGMVTNGSYPSYANTFLTPSTTLTLNDVHMSVYARNNTNTGNDMGAHSNANTKVMYMATRYSGNFQTLIGQSAGGGEDISVSNADSSGFYVSTRRSSSDEEAYKNGSSIGTNTTTATGTRPEVSIFIGDRNFDGSALGEVSTRQYAFASIGAGLTDTEDADMHYRLQKVGKVIA